MVGSGRAFLRRGLMGWIGVGIVTSTLGGTSFALHSFGDDAHSITTLTAPAGRFYITAAVLHHPHLYIASHNGKIAHYTLPHVSPTVHCVTEQKITSLTFSPGRITLTAGNKITYLSLPSLSQVSEINTPYMLQTPTEGLRGNTFYSLQGDLRVTHSLPTHAYTFDKGSGRVVYPSSDGRELYIASPLQIRTLIQPLSGREFNAAVIFKNTVFFGGEDTLVHSLPRQEWPGKKHISSIFGLAANETHIFSAGGNAELVAWRLESGQITPENTFFPTAEVLPRYTGIATITGGVVVAASDGTVLIYTYTPTEGFLLKNSRKLGSCCLCVSVYKEEIAVGLTSGEVVLLSTSLSILSRWSATPGAVKSLAFSFAGILAGGDDGGLWFGSQEGEGRWSVGHRAGVVGVCFIPDGAVSVAADGSVILWSITDHGLVKRMEVDGSIEDPGAVIFSPPNEVIVAGIGVESFTFTM